jgi:hypothetical protein
MAIRKDAEVQAVGVGFQVVLFLISSIVLFIIFYPRFMYFKAYDAEPPFIHWSSEEEKSSKAIETGLYLRNFITFDVTKNNFKLGGILWFNGNVDVMQNTDLKKFHVLNGAVTHISEQRIVHHDTKMLVYFDVQIDFQAPLDYRKFPLDDHRITFGLSNHFIDQDIVFVSSAKNMTFAPYFYLPGWKFVGWRIATGYSPVSLVPGHEEYQVKHPRIIFALDSKKIDPCDIMTMLFALMLILLIVVFTLSSTSDRLQIISGSIISLIGYRFVVQTLAPSQVHYFMLSDYIFLSALIAIMVGLFSILTIRQKSLNSLVQKISICAIYMVFVGGCWLAVM